MVLFSWAPEEVVIYSQRNPLVETFAKGGRKHLASPSWLCPACQSQPALPGHSHPPFPQLETVTNWTWTDLCLAGDQLIFHWWSKRRVCSVSKKSFAWSPTVFLEIASLTQAHNFFLFRIEFYGPDAKSVNIFFLRLFQGTAYFWRVQRFGGIPIT